MKSDSDWRKEMLKTLKVPLQIITGSIYDAEGNLLANMYRERDCVITPVYRDELAKELVKRFNEYDETTKVNKKTHTTILAALRYLQANRDNALEAVKDLDDTSGTKSYLLTEEEIDALCERINFNDLRIGVK
jgi:hypothetical protein